MRGGSFGWWAGWTRVGCVCRGKNRPSSEGFSTAAQLLRVMVSRLVVNRGRCDGDLLRREEASVQTRLGGPPGKRRDGAVPWTRNQSTLRRPTTTMVSLSVMGSQKKVCLQATTLHPTTTPWKKDRPPSSPPVVQRRARRSPRQPTLALPISLSLSLARSVSVRPDFLSLSLYSPPPPPP